MYGAVDSTESTGEGQRDDIQSSIRSTASLTKNKRHQNAASDLDVLMHLVKANIGTGMLALPNAFSRSGIVFGVTVLLAMAFIAVHCMILLVRSSQYLTKRFGLDTLEYGQVTEMAFVNLRWERINFGCCRVRSVTLGKIGKFVVNMFLVLTQFGFCTVYFVFVGNTLVQVGELYFHVDLRLWILILLVPYILLSWIRDVKTLAPLMALANVCMFLGLAVVLYDMIAHFATQEAAVNCVSSANQSANQSGITPASTIVCEMKFWPSMATDLFIFFGVAMYSFEGIGVVLPLENTMKKPQHFTAVVYTGMSIVATMYLSTGLLGYLAYGNCVYANVIQNLQSNEIALKILFLIVQLLMGYVIYASFAIQFYVPMDFLEAPLMNLLGLKDPVSGRHLSRGKRILKIAAENTFRGLVVTLLCGLALIEPSRLGDIISLVGAVASTALALTFPPLIHILVFYCGDKWHLNGCGRLQQHERDADEVNSTTGEDPPLLKKKSSSYSKGDCAISSICIVKNLAITTLGAVGGVLGTYAAISDLVESIVNPSGTCN